jgi:hypothetical protein
MDGDIGLLHFRREKAGSGHFDPGSARLMLKVEPKSVSQLDGRSLTDLGVHRTIR